MGSFGKMGGESLIVSAREAVESPRFQPLKESLTIEFRPITTLSQSGSYSKTNCVAGLIQGPLKHSFTPASHRETPVSNCA